MSENIKPKPEAKRAGIGIPPTPKQVQFVKNLRTQYASFTVPGIPNGAEFDTWLDTASRREVSSAIDTFLHFQRTGAFQVPGPVKFGGNTPPANAPAYNEPEPADLAREWLVRLREQWHPKTKPYAASLTQDKVLLVVDVANTYARAAYRMPELAHYGRPTGGIFGLFQSVDTACKMVRNLEDGKQPDVLFAYEGGGSARRQMLLPEYKSARAGGTWLQNDDDVAYIEAMAFESGVTSVHMPGGEADDVIAWISNNAAEIVKAHHRNIKVYVLSNDKDMLRLTRHDNVAVLRSGGEIVRRKDFVDKYGYEPEHDILVKALAGGDDDWKGIRGIGTKGAVRILQDASWYWHLVIEHPKVKPHADKVVNAVQVMDFWAPDVEDTEFPVKAIAPSTFHQTRVSGALGITRHFWFPRSHA